MTQPTAGIAANALAWASLSPKLCTNFGLRVANHFKNFPHVDDGLEFANEPTEVVLASNIASPAAPVALASFTPPEIALTPATAPPIAAALSTKLLVDCE